MQRILAIGALAVVIIVILYACSLGGGSEPTETTLTGDTPVLTLAVQSQNETLNTPGQIITYTYVVTNSGSTVLAGPVAVTDNKTNAACPEVTTVGNNDGNLDPGEVINCTSTYSITQEDLNNSSVKSAAVASVGGASSNTVETTVQMTLSQMLELTIIANPTTYNDAGQVITFTYSVKNKGGAAIGPAQFVIIDDKLGTFNCGGADSTLAPEQSFDCGASYTISDSDKSAEKITFNSIVNGGGATIIQPVTTTVTNTALGGGSSSNLTKGSNIQHQVNDGEWMIQIARCYGADFKAVRSANPQVIDANKIWPINVLTIPNIGSNGKIYGPPCVTYYTAQSGDTWESIAKKYNADLAVLLEANKTLTLANGTKLKIPLNSANGNPVTPVGNEPERLTLPSGSNTVAVSGTVSVSKGKKRYVINASQGQTLRVKVNSPGAELQLAVLSISGTVIKAQDANLDWSGTIPAYGDYYIDIINVTSTDRLYQMEVGLTSPTTAFERVSDINAGTADSSPAYPAIFNGVLYFRATGGDNTGAELWKYDATANAVSRVKDINSGPDGSNPAYLASYEGALYFSANGNDGAGNELWRFNGTDVGRLTDISNGAGDSNPSFMTVYKGLLYFSANGNDGTGVELWQTNGTTYNRVADINSGDGNSNPSYLTVFNDTLYFSAASNDGAGTELWKFDGTNITRVTDINNGVGNANPSFLTVFNNALYFSATSSDGTGTELWKFDGTNAARAADINSTGDSNPAYLTVFSSKLYFSANGNDGKGFELWVFDGATATRVSDLNTTGDTFPSFLIVYNNQLYFQASSSDGTGKELWRYKGP